MTRDPHPETLFHLVPSNQVARDALLDSGNKRFVSKSSRGVPGLEVGFHVPSTSLGRVITRLGSNADLTLRRSSSGKPMWAEHVAFEFNPASNVVVVSVRANKASVKFSALVSRLDRPDRSDLPRPTLGDGVILYTQDYRLSIAAYKFLLLWARDSEPLLRNIAFEGYRRALVLLKNIGARELLSAEDDDLETYTWPLERLQSAKKHIVKEIPGTRTFVGNGAFGKVFQAIDNGTGYRFAIKVVELEKYSDIRAARALMYQEMKILDSLRHEHIIECLGHHRFDTFFPEIFMPLREGSLTSLIRKEVVADHRRLCLDVLQQMLSALDYLASKDLVHRDVKPDNILYARLPEGDGFLFQLSDFGLAHYRSMATTICGTGFYQAPELRPEESQIDAPQSPKMDVWSLFATMVAIDSRFRDFPPRADDYGVVLGVLQAKAPTSLLEPMARLDPNRRASAAQMLVQLFAGKGLTTLSSRVAPIEPARPEPFAAVLSAPPYLRRLDAVARPPRVRSLRSRRCQSSEPGRRGHKPARPASQPVRVPRDGVKKRWMAPPAARRANLITVPRRVSTPSSMLDFSGRTLPISEGSSAIAARQRFAYAITRQECQSGEVTTESGNSDW
ncbi:hypothetical protein VTK73DRAFT_8661 [Phialemonium thermophilum]|uniref:Protein kinase domain-containing protein n=1 Tax=Phialemonium thermophilum TaxID=223376 RepID=A0ABR3XMZ9_9PEZI